MVNTFLLDRDFRISAAKLDRQRLGKQRVEAYQILIVLRQYRFLARYFNLSDYPVGTDTSKEQRRNWIKSIVSTFKASGLIGLHIRGNAVIEYPLGSMLPRRPTSGNQLYYDSETGVVYETKGVRKQIVASGSWCSFVLPGEELITRKIRINPAIDMWLGFEEALKDYINAHIEVWVSRGYKNNMQLYSVGDYPRPTWSYSEKIINNFKSALVQREIERMERAWYLRQPDCISAWATSEENGNWILTAMTETPDTWWQCFKSETLLKLGQFHGYIWP